MSLPTDLVRRIKALQKSRGVEDDQYRAMLGGYGVESCKDLTVLQAQQVIAFLEKLPVAPGYQKKGKPDDEHWPKRWDHLGYREGMATSAQLRHLEGLFVGVSYKETLEEKQAAFPHFLRNKFNIWQVEHISQEMVGPIKRALQGMIYARKKKSQEANRGPV